ncbi:MAG: CvpA family protein [Pirellulales bacterium]|nr:CvpA family protein [Pirellulales bacterium]
MQPYDIAMIIVLVGTTAFGFLKGAAWQVASLASIGVSCFTALRFSERFAPLFGQQAPLNRFAAMLALYIGTSFVVWLLFRVVAGTIDRVKLKEFDRQVGGLFGIAKGVLLCVVITFFAVTLSEAMRKQVLQSQSGTYIARFIDWADPIMPAEVREVLAPYLNRLEDGLRPDGPQPAFPIPGLRLGQGGDLVPATDWRSAGDRIRE